MATLVNREMWLVRSDIDIVRVIVASQDLAKAECDVISGNGTKMTVSAYDLYEQEIQARQELSRREKTFGSFKTKD